MVLWIIISVLVFLLLWILFAPLIIRLDSDKQRYSLSLPGIFKALVVPDEDLFHIRLWVLFIPFRIDPYGRSFGRKDNGDKEDKKRRKGNLLKNIRAKILGLKAFWYSFRLKKLRLNLDTDDFILNSHLVPVFTSLNSRDVTLTVNYNGEISLFMVLKNRLANLLWIGIKYLYRTKY